MRQLLGLMFVALGVLGCASGNTDTCAVDRDCSGGEFCVARRCTAPRDAGQAGANRADAASVAQDAAMLANDASSLAIDAFSVAANDSGRPDGGGGGTDAAVAVAIDAAVPRDSCLNCGVMWSAAAWSSCSVLSGGGTQTRTVQCVRASDQVVVADSLCTAAKPPSTQDCNLQTRMPLDCNDASIANWVLYRSVGHRCGETAGIAYWNEQINVRGVTPVQQDFPTAYDNDCMRIAGTTDRTTCNSAMLCNPGFRYVANTTGCAR